MSESRIDKGEAIVLSDFGLTEDIWRQLQNEDASQMAKWGIQRHDIFRWLAFTMEELGELSQAVSEYVYREGNLKDISKEAIQVATLAGKIACMVQREKEALKHEPKER